MARHPTVLITTAEGARRMEVGRERLRQLLEHKELTGIRIEGRERERYVDLSSREGRRATGCW